MEIGHMERTPFHLSLNYIVKSVRLLFWFKMMIFIIFFIQLHYVTNEKHEVAIEKVKL